MSHKHALYEVLALTVVYTAIGLVAWGLMECGSRVIDAVTPYEATQSTTEEEIS